MSSSNPQIKFEDSPVESLADSFVSTPGTQYPSLFDTMDQSELMSPESFDDDSMFGGSMRGDSMGPAPEKKPVKKRKSWGQQLPEPTTNLPPRKRAKTEAEKEQRRVERVLRNRRAAQSSRERKRQEVEKLDEEKQQLERMVRDMELQLANERAKRLEAERELELERAANGKNMTVFRGSSPPAHSPAHTEQFRQAPSPITLSQELFSSSDSARHESIASTYTIASPSSIQTVNPAALSPEVRAVDEPTNASSSDMTQHPAVSVGRTTALDGFNFSDNNVSNLLEHSSESTYQFNYFDAPQPTESDMSIFENRVLPLTDNFDLNFDHLAYNHDSVINDFNIEDYLHHDENNQPAPDAQSSDSLAKSIANLQPQFGASTYGCDDGGNAVSI